MSRLNFVSFIVFLNLALGASAYGMSCSKLTGKTVQGQNIIASRVKTMTPRVLKFIKDTPILGYRISSANFSDLPGVIQQHLGGVDKTDYSPEYLQNNIGSIIALQMNGETPDFYIIDKETYNSKYTPTTVNDVVVKNEKLISGMQSDPTTAALFSDPTSSLVGALKTVPVEMIKMSDIGFKVDQEITIQSPWGEQTKPAGQDAYLVWDSSQDMFYMVNSNPEGLPINYIPENFAD